MSGDNRKMIVREVLERWNTGDTRFVDEYYSEDFEFWSSTGDSTNLDGFKDIIIGAHSTFDRYEVKPDYMIAEDDRVAARVRIKGKHVEEYRGINPTGKKFEIISIYMYKFREGKIIHEEHRSDYFGLLNQLTEGNLLNLK